MIENTLQVIVTLNIKFFFAFDDRVPYDQIEEIALNAVSVRPVEGLMYNGYYHVHENNKEICYYDL